MPNWCYTNTTLHSKTKEPIIKVKELIEKVFSKLPGPPSPIWWGELLKEIEIDPNKINCRGNIEVATEILFNEKAGEYYFTLDSEDAWGPKSDYVIPEVLNYLEVETEVDYCYLASEPGCGIFMNTDRSRLFFPWEYWLDGYVSTKHGSLSGGDFVTRKELIAYLNRIFHKDNPVGITEDELYEVVSECSEQINEDIDEYLTVERLEY